MIICSPFFRIPITAAAVVAAALLCGCASNSKPELTESQKQDEYLAHPMDYKLQVQEDRSGDTAGFDSAGFNRDLHEMLGF